MSVCTFTLAINRVGNGADFPRIKCFGTQAENCGRYLNKGRKVAVEGRIQTDSYEKDGRKIYTTDVVAYRVEFIGGVQSDRQEEENVAEQFAQVESGVPF